MSKVLVFAGTTEGRLLAEGLKALGAQVVASVATEYGRESLAGLSGIQIHTGRMDRGEMEGLIRREGIPLVVDATHPYAKEATREIQAACQAAGAKLLRCLRREDEAVLEEVKDWVIRFPSIEEAVRWLESREGNILVTTGSKELAAFSGLMDFRERVYARVLPTAEAMAVCRDLGLSGRHIAGIQGPFSVQFNLAMIRELDCQFLVTKDSGREGGLEEKLKAAARAGIYAVVVERPCKESGMSVEEVLDWYGTNNPS